MTIKKNEFKDLDNREIEIKPCEDGFIFRYTADIYDNSDYETVNKYRVYKDKPKEIKQMLYDILEYLEIDKEHIIEIKIDEEIDEKNN